MQRAAAHSTIKIIVANSTPLFLSFLEAVKNKLLSLFFLSYLNYLKLTKYRVKISDSSKKRVCRHQCLSTDIPRQKWVRSQDKPCRWTSLRLEHSEHLCDFAGTWGSSIHRIQVLKSQLQEGKDTIFFLWYVITNQIPHFTSEPSFPMCSPVAHLFWNPKPDLDIKAPCKKSEDNQVPQKDGFRRAHQHSPNQGPRSKATSWEMGVGVLGFYHGTEETTLLLH